MINWKELEQLFNFKILHKTSLKGGDISSVYKIETVDETYVLKVNDASSKDMFEAEMKGMNMLASTDSLLVPKVLKVDRIGDKIFLLMEYVIKGNQTEQTFTEFGKSLAKLHEHTQETFGLDHDNWIGALPQSNKKHDDWEVFYCVERIQPQLEMAIKRNYLSSEEIPTEQTIINTANQIYCPSAPSLLHGDLWNGNFLITTQGQVALIDPAVYYGHPMMDIGMTKLFGGFSSNFYSAYFRNANISGDIEAQIDLSQLYYLLVHLNLFGSGYKSQVVRILNRYF